jgi:branched-chain amino acid transport system ATP-binding protein
MKRHAPLMAALALLALAPWVLPVFWVTLLNYIGLASLVVLGLCLMTGIAGQVSFGQAAFVGLGAYASAVLATVYGVSPWLGLLAGFALTAAVALILGAITLSLSGHFLPLATIAWGISLYYVFGNLDIVGGFSGLSGIPPLALLGFELRSGQHFFYVIWLCVVLASITVTWLLDSRNGRAIRALQGNTVMAEAFGIGTAWLKIKVFILAALLASLSGWLYAHMQRFVNPTPFGINIGMEYLFMAVIGGAGHVAGAIAGSTIVILLQQALKDLIPGLLGQSGEAELIAFGLLTILVLHRARGGLWGFVSQALPRTRRRPAVADAPALPARNLPEPGSPLLSVLSAQKSFGGLTAVNDVSFELRAGDIVGLIGPNGAGKTTTFNLITGLMPLSAGEIRFQRRIISGLAARDIARLGIARTFQHVRLLGDRSVLENVALGAHLHGRAGIARSMLRLERGEERALLAHAARQLARVGLEDDMHAAAGSLPLGKQRIVEVARALAADPVLLLLDEPAAGLRYLEKQQLAEVLRGLRNEGMSILLVEHDMEFVMGLADTLVVLDFGTKLAEGEPARIRTDPAVLEAYLGGVE